MSVRLEGDRDGMASLAAAMLPSSLSRAAFSPVRPGDEESLFNVRLYGAAGDGRTDDSPAFQKVVDAIAAAGHPWW